MEKKSIEELEDLLAKHEAETQKLKEEIEQAKQAKHTENVSKVLHLMEVLGVRLDDLKPGANPSKKASNTGKKLMPKYRDPATGKTWSGRGSVPKWLKDYEEQDRKQDEFLTEAKDEK